MNAREYVKAAAGALASGLSAAGTALADGTITPQEWTVIGVAVLVGAGLVAVAPRNEDPTVLARMTPHGNIVAGEASNLPGSYVDPAMSLGGIVSRSSRT